MCRPLKFYIARVGTGQVGEEIFAQVAKGLQIDLAFTGTPPPGLRRGQTLPIRLALIHFVVLEGCADQQELVLDNRQP